MTLKHKYLAINQYGEQVFIEKHPRKELMEWANCKHCKKIYIDGKDGKRHHVGYFVGGNWFNVMRLLPFKD